ncbi:MAG: hypothetical protein A3G05_01650 [Candidatus Zambryskibacteria bacterium RIFCSPLOWO2_12_FULL_45_14]|uniref:Uncharacterized protein n=2 Tax=Candidatus Zambryskiibacteriota TaxID=1817925 RepID=A0A1G2UQ20_9BACT|nr:MAG: hypothetical protein A3H60_02545 [Candidatus Zambryskibacteria bacterium RIFCSPLOWO2_02_FULL_44_12b]OHB14371.1 MAG: hypothetical protein A3G05_01650 [Candidatus Zambryskibacteria bacterium RIFCSPLOWO2_12_FULL_45_14]
MLGKNKIAIIAVVIFLLLMLSYNVFFKSETVSLPDESSATLIGEDLIKIFNELKAVTLDQSIFSSKGYLLLTDFSKSVPQQAIGRPNPFNVIGRD